MRTIGESSSITFWRLASGSPPPRAISVLARAAMLRSLWAASAWLWASESWASETSPFSTPSRNAAVHSGLESRARLASVRTTGVIAESRSTIARPTSGASLRPAASTRPAASPCGDLGVIRPRSVWADFASPGRNSMSRLAASTRAPSGCFSSTAVASNVEAISAVWASIAFEPHREARLTS